MNEETISKAEHEKSLRAMRDRKKLFAIALRAAMDARINMANAVRSISAEIANPDDTLKSVSSIDFAKIHKLIRSSYLQYKADEAILSRDATAALVSTGSVHPFHALEDGESLYHAPVLQWKKVADSTEETAEFLDGVFRVSKESDGWKRTYPNRPNNLLYKTCDAAKHACQLEVVEFYKEIDYGLVYLGIDYDGKHLFKTPPLIWKRANFGGSYATRTAVFLGEKFVVSYDIQAGGWVSFVRNEDGTEDVTTRNRLARDTADEAIILCMEDMRLQLFECGFTPVEDASMREERCKRKFLPPRLEWVKQEGSSTKYAESIAGKFTITELPTGQFVTTFWPKWEKTSVSRVLQTSDGESDDTEQIKTCEAYYYQGLPELGFKLTSLPDGRQVVYPPLFTWQPLKDREGFETNFNGIQILVIRDKNNLDHWQWFYNPYGLRDKDLHLPEDPTSYSYAEAAKQAFEMTVCHGLMLAGFREVIENKL